MVYTFNSDSSCRLLDHRSLDERKPVDCYNSNVLIENWLPVCRLTLPFSLPKSNFPLLFTLSRTRPRRHIHKNSLRQLYWKGRCLYYGVVCICCCCRTRYSGPWRGAGFWFLEGDPSNFIRAWPHGECETGEKTEKEEVEAVKESSRRSVACILQSRYVLDSS